MKRLPAAVCLAAVLLGACSPATDAPAAPETAGTAASVPPAPTSTNDALAAPPGLSTAAPKAAPRPDPLAAFYRQRLSWKRCGDGFSCAKAAVPLDYARPASTRIQIAMIKLPARSAKARIGSLFLNPGGPGGSGIEYARYAEGAIPRAVRDRFDIVGFDPRGVGQSAPIRCGTSKQLEGWLSVDPSPDTAAELSQFVDVAKAVAAGCRQKSGALLPHVNTRNTARDLDIMRAAVGDKKLSYVGKSYGTYLGALYADLFPTRVRALLLDGAVDPTVDTQTLGRVQARGFEVALEAFLEDCDGSRSCAFGAAPGIRRRFDAVLARIERSPLPAGRGRAAGPDETYFGVAQALYSREFGWPALRTALAQAEKGDGTTLYALFERYVDRDANGDYSNLVESYTAISCVDRPSPRDLATYQADAKRQAAESPHFGAAAAFSGLPCAYWPTPAVGPPAALPARGAAPILVIGTTRDPATPLVWAQALARQLKSGRLLTYDGDGHTIYGDGNACVDRRGNAYLVDLVVPAKGAHC